MDLAALTILIENIVVIVPDIVVLSLVRKMKVVVAVFLGTESPRDQLKYSIRIIHYVMLIVVVMIQLQ